MSQIVLLSGNILNLAGCYDVLKITDVAAGLSGIRRFSNQLERPITVAQHSVLVSRLCHQMFNGCFRRAGLMHDAHEFITQDLAGPVKDMVGNGYKDFEADIAAKVRHRFGLPPVLGLEVKEADIRSRCIEVYNCASNAAAVSFKKLGLEPEPVKIEIWDERRAYNEFLMECKALGVY